MFDPEILLKIPKVYKGQVLKSFGELTKNLVKRKGLTRFKLWEMRTHKQYINATVCLSSQTALISLFKGVFSRNISTVLTKTVILVGHP